MAESVGAVSVGAAHLGVVLVGHHEIPAVEAVLAAIGDDVAGFPDAVLGRVGEQEAPATAVDADDLRGRE